MIDAAQIARTKELWRLKALEYHTICQEIEAALELGKSHKEALRDACTEHAGDVISLSNGEKHTLPLSPGNLRRLFDKWKPTRGYLVFLPDYKPGKQRMPRALINEFHRRRTMPGLEAATRAMKSLHQDWAEGREIPGLGRWQEWWAREHPERPLPPQAPEFPFSDRTFYRHAPSKAAVARGTRGSAEAKKHLPHPERDYGSLRPGELYVFDDVRLDLVCIDNATGQPTEVKAYVAIDAATRFIPAITLRPANAMIGADVDALVVEALRTLGIGRDFVTHLLFERGTLTMSRPAKEMLERVGEGRIAVHYTSMNGARAWPGAPLEAGAGNWMGKAVIESFMRKLHLLLMDAPGQRGSSYRRQPQSLGYTGHQQTPRPGTLAHEAQQLAEIELTFGRRIRLNLGLMWLHEVNTLLRDAITEHNTDHGHSYEDFGWTTQQEMQPGIWEDAVPGDNHQEPCN
jgi:hypothetical protein